MDRKNIVLDDQEIDLIVTYLRGENTSEQIHTYTYNRMNAPVQRARAAKLVEKLLKLKGK